MPHIEHDASGEEQVVASKNEARQGRELHRMRYVVTIGTIGAFAALTILYFMYA